MVKNQGLSLFELLFVLVIFAILCCFALPLSLNLMQNSHGDRIKEELVAAIHYAKAKAILEKKSFALIPLSNQLDWSKGMLLVLEDEKNQIKQIHQWQWNLREIEIRWHGLESNNYLRFASDFKHAATSGHFIIKIKGGEIYKLIVNRLGRVREELI